MIPKVIYQTWKTKDIPSSIKNVIDKFLYINKEYQHVLYDDKDIDKFIQENFSDYVYKCYSQLNVGAAKADFWRYCILYIHGGVYLDIDADITDNIDSLIQSNDVCILTREGNQGYFNNWFMISSKRHPILRRCIELCCENIHHRTTDDVCFLTGPHGPLTKAINEIMIPLYNKNVDNLYYEKDDDLNNSLNRIDNSIRCRFYDVDMGKYGKWKNSSSEDLYKNNVYWRSEKKIFKDI